MRTSAAASNWIDRGEPAEPKVAKILRHFLRYDPALGDEALRTEVEVFMAMVTADASEVQVAAYLAHLEDRYGHPRVAGHQRRLTAIAIWHVAKAAMVRDAALAESTIVGRRPYDEPVRLSNWLSDRIMRATGHEEAPGE